MPYLDWTMAPSLPELRHREPLRGEVLHVLRDRAGARLPVLRHVGPAGGEVLHVVRHRARAGDAAGRRPGAAARPGRATALPEERRQVTVVFADLSGYTAVAERMDPEAVKSLVDRSLRRLGRGGRPLRRHASTSTSATT